MSGSISRIYAIKQEKVQFFVTLILERFTMSTEPTDKPQSHVTILTERRCTFLCNAIPIRE